MPTPPTPPPPRGKTRPKVHFDWEEWLPYLDQSDASEAEKRELITTLWNIVIAFVDLGWEVGAPEVQMSDSDAETSGQVSELTTVLRSAMVNCEDQAKEEV